MSQVIWNCLASIRGGIGDLGHDSRIGVHRYDNGDSVYIHVLNYAFDREQDAVQEIDKVEITLTSLPGKKVRVFHLDGETQDFEAHCDKDEMRLTLYHVAVYSLVVIRSCILLR